MTPPRTDAEIAFLSGMDEATQRSWLRWWELRDACKVHGRSALKWLKIAVKHAIIAAYIGILLNLTLIFAGF